MKAFGLAIQSCSPKNWGALLYPLQLLTSNQPLATLLGMKDTAHLQAVLDRGPAPVSSIPSVSEIPVPQMGAKHWCYSSDQGVLPLRWEEEETADINYPPKEHHHHKQKEGRPAAKALKEPYWEAFSKELEVVKVARWAFFKAHWLNFEQEGSYDLSPTFWQMATSTNLLGTKIHEVQESCGGRKDLQATNQTAKSFSKDIHFFRVVAPTESPKIMGLKGIHLPEALKWQSGLTFCPWCGKEGQNEGTVANICRLYITTWTPFMPAVWTISPQVQMICINTPSSASPQELASMMMTGRNLPQTMRKMTMVMRTLSSCLKSTSLLHQLHVLCSHGKLAPLHWCPCWGRLFLSSPSSNSNCRSSSAHSIAHYTLCSTAVGNTLPKHLINTQLLSISQHSITISHYVINGSCIKYLPLCFVLK